MKGKMQTSKEIFIPQTYDEYLRAVHKALVDAGVEMHQRTKDCGKFATKEGGIKVTQDREEIVTQYGLVRFVENVSLISIEKNIIRFVGII